MQHVDVLRNDAVTPTKVFKMFQSAVHGARLKALEAIDELCRAFIVDARIAVEPVDVEDSFGVWLLVEPLWSPEIRDAAEC